ncbi:DUF6126 family protein [Streptomyces sp. NPDC051018]|uniref:DUF6126 family protein n=1 Tax=Streptomyces sp. NPDC051018 TaxID=3365639 RepID=UPI00379E62CB
MSESPVVPEGSGFAEGRKNGEVEKEKEGRFPRGIWIRLLAYLVVGHVLAGFLYLLFEVGAK